MNVNEMVWTATSSECWTNDYFEDFNSDETDALRQFSQEHHSE